MAGCWWTRRRMRPLSYGIPTEASPKCPAMEHVAPLLFCWKTDSKPMLFPFEPEQEAKLLRVLPRKGAEHWFEMEMGVPRFEAEHFLLPLTTGQQPVTILNVGNPQCVVVVENFDLDWRSMGAEIERHPHFPNRTNVSFVRPVNRHSIEVRFFERGAGETNSSGTGSTGAAAAAIRLGIAESPVEVLTPAGSLQLRWGETISLTGPAEVIAEGTFRYEKMA